MINFKTVVLSTIVALFLLSSCDISKKSVSYPIIFKPMFNGEEVNCHSQFSHSDKQWQYSQLQLFLSHFQFKNKYDKWEDLPLNKSAFQSNNSVLLGERCEQSNAKSKTYNNANWQILLAEEFDTTRITHIRFTLGLPFEVNHLNPLTQESPLNIPSMFWSWQNGHKFLRLEMMAANDNWLFHLGSLGCNAPSPLRAPAQACRYPNRYTFELPLNTENPLIALDLSSLLLNIMLSEKNHCQSAPENTACKTLFDNLSAKHNNNNSVFRLINKVASNE